MTPPIRTVSVPVEPTEAMMNACPSSFSPSFAAIWPKICRDIYQAMLSAAPAPEGGAIVRWRGDGIPYTCPYPSIGVRGSPYGYNIDPGAGSGMDRLQRNWPDRAQVRDMRERDGEITPLFPSYALATREEAPAEAGRDPYDVEHGLAGVEGFGASYSREKGKWLLYSMPGAKPFGSVDGFDRAAIDFVIDALRSHRTALRAQPQAREEAQPVGVVDGLIGRLNTAELDDGTPLYTTPPAPEAEKLRSVLADVVSWFTKPVQGERGLVWVIPAGERGADDAVSEALAALQAEQGAK